MCATSNCKIWTLEKTCAVISYLFTFFKKKTKNKFILHFITWTAFCTQAYIQFRIIYCDMHIFGLLEKAEISGRHPHTGKRPPADQNRRVQPKTFLLWDDRANHLRHHPMHTSINTAHVWNHLFYSIWFPECAKDWDVSMMWVKNNMRKAVAWLTQTDNLVINASNMYVKNHHSAVTFAMTWWWLPNVCIVLQHVLLSACVLC